LNIPDVGWDVVAEGEADGDGDDWEPVAKNKQIHK
jgi:hypothetical protein